MIDMDQILGMIRVKGPVIPVQISKEIGKDIITASAVLGDLASQGKLKISNVKIGGGSPLYYLPGQENQLQNFSDKLNDKDKTSYQKLMQDKVLRDSDQTPLMRVSLRSIKDFAIPLDVTIGDKKERFWKWYLLSGDDATARVKDMMGIKDKKPEPKKEIPSVAVQAPNQDVKPKPFVVKSIPKVQAMSEPIKPKLMIKKIEEPAVKVPEKQKTLPEPEPEVKPKPVPEKKAEPKIPDTPFIEEINNFFKKNNITVVESKIIRKASDAEFIVEIPSVVGMIAYFCKAKSKKKLNEGDLSAAFVQGQMKKMPVLFLSKGDLTKKAESMLNTEFKNLKIKNI